MIPFIFIFWWLGPFWRRYFVDFIDNYLFYPLEMVENGLIRDWKWQLKNFKTLIMLSPNQQHHLWPNFNASDTPKEKILVILIPLLPPDWTGNASLEPRYAAKVTRFDWNVKNIIVTNFLGQKMGQKLFILDNLIILVKISHFTPWFETKVVIPEAAPEYQLPFLDFCDAQHSSKLWWKNWRWYPEQN